MRKQSQANLECVRCLARKRVRVHRASGQHCANHFPRLLELQLDLIVASQGAAEPGRFGSPRRLAVKARALSVDDLLLLLGDLRLAQWRGVACAAGARFDSVLVRVCRSAYDPHMRAHTDAHHIAAPRVL